MRELERDRYQDREQDREFRAPEAERGGTPGRRTLTSGLSAPLHPVQLKAAPAGWQEPFPIYSGQAFESQLVPDLGVHEVAQAGLAGGATELPHREAIQRSFGAHDISGVSAHVGGGAAAAAEQLGAIAYATGDHVAFAGTPDLHTAAHEVTHVMQQRGGVQLKAGPSAARDEHELAGRRGRRLRGPRRVGGGDAGPDGRGRRGQRGRGAAEGQALAIACGWPHWPGGRHSRSTATDPQPARGRSANTLDDPAAGA